MTTVGRKDDSNIDSPYKAAPRFCELAVEMGFITKEQSDEALLEQISNDPSHRLRSKRLIGQVLLERGAMTNRQVGLVLERLRTE